MMRRIVATAVFVAFLATMWAPAASIRGPHQRRSARRAHARHWRRPAVLRGSRAKLVRQNQEIDRLGLHRIADEQELEEMELRGDLVELHQSPWLQVARNLKLNRRFCRPWTRDFLEDMSQAYYARFHRGITVTSAVRTMEQQARLQRRNGNAAPIEGDTASSHLAGLTIDIGKRSMGRRERAWVREYLVTLQNLGLVEAIEERHQACFHIMVSIRYHDYRNSPEAFVATRESTPEAGIN
jgi:Ni/Co efflux regulator RcnB